MTPLTITLDIEADPGPFAAPARLLNRRCGDDLAALTNVGLLRHGTQGGNAVVVVLATLPDGCQVAAQTTWRLFRTAYLALAASPAVAEEVIDP